MTRRRLALATLTITLLAAGTAWAAFEQEGAPYPTGDAPYAVYAADFNVSVRDTVKRKTVIVRAGRSYTARRAR